MRAGVAERRVPAVSAHATAHAPGPHAAGPHPRLDAARRRQRRLLRPRKRLARSRAQRRRRRPPRLRHRLHRRARIRDSAHGVGDAHDRVAGSGRPHGLALRARVAARRDARRSTVCAARASRLLPHPAASTRQTSAVGRASEHSTTCANTAPRFRCGAVCWRERYCALP